MLPGGPYPLIRLGGLGERSSSPSGSGHSPAARRFLVHFRLKRTLLVNCATFAVLKRESSSFKKSRWSGQSGASHKGPPPKYATAVGPPLACCRPHLRSPHTAFKHATCDFDTRISHTAFLTCVSHTALSVRLSVTRWYCVETAQPIVKLSSLPGSGSTMILVF